MANYRYFVDLSSNNARIGAASFNAAEYAKAGHTTVAIKVSQGATYVNPFWEQWARDAHKQHLSLILYHYGDNTSPAVAQAVHFAQTIKTAGLFMASYDAVALDLEQGQSPADPVLFRAAFEEETRTRGFANLIVYSDAGYLLQYGSRLRPKQGGRMWVAALDKNRPIPAGWYGSDPWARQYSFTGSVRGVVGAVDLNRLKLAPALWRRVHRP